MVLPCVKQHVLDFAVRIDESAHAANVKYKYNYESPEAKLGVQLGNNQYSNV